jgi:uncharacterized protein (DUF1778 family)
MASQTTARIDLRLRADLKRLLEEAAELSAQTVAGFVTSTVVERAKSVVESARRVRLGRADAEAFLAALERPVDLNDSLSRMIRDVEKRTKSASRRGR